ncbi:hypothetical protein J2X46_002509 [Nocardioides sp. BE266]|uniref:hypothetical protein n=1 Tax=Nocardioides sp. BE266 TaxID=2817725 RepID=UPI002858F026|nr:hypothetical protein [Nocardioides sp. BE266]MDR7253519.1 hypothetical protein [Nocardioides sp. BE266]
MTTATLTELPDDPETTAPPRRRHRGPVVLVLVLALVLLGGALGWRAWSQQRADIRSGTTLVDADGLAAAYGIDVDMVAVTAAGGLIELRYQVVDPDKADRINHDPSLAPAFVVEDTGETLVMKTAPHHHGAELRLGGTYFFLMANAHNAVHKGAEVTLVMGELRMQHLVVQG